MSLSHPRTRDQHDHSWRKTEEFIRVQDLEKFVQKQVEEVRIPHHDKLRAIASDASNLSSPRAYWNMMSQKFMIPTFDCYSVQSDPVPYLRQYQEKMVIHARNDSILCRIFPSSLKGVASDRFHFLLPRSIHSFEDFTKLFLA